MIVKSKQQLKRLISEDNIEEVFELLLSSDLKHKNKIYNGIINLKASYIDIKHHMIQGIFSIEDISKSKNRIRRDLASILDLIPAPLFEGGQNTNKPNDKSNDYSAGDKSDNYLKNDVFSSYNESYASLSKDLLNIELGELAKAKVTLQLTLEEILEGTTNTYEYEVTDFKTNKKRKVSISIPIAPGVSSKHQVNLKNKGHFLQSGKRGGLQISITELPHKHFKRKGDDLHTNLEVKYITAINGGTFELTTLDGKISFNIPPKVKNNSLFKFRGKGLPNFKTKKRGDLYCEILVGEKGL